MYLPALSPETAGECVVTLIGRPRGHRGNTYPDYDVVKAVLMSIQRIEVEMYLSKSLVSTKQQQLLNILPGNSWDISKNEFNYNELHVDGVTFNEDTISACFKVDVNIAVHMLEDERNRIFKCT